MSYIENGSLVNYARRYEMPGHEGRMNNGLKFYNAKYAFATVNNSLYKQSYENNFTINWGFEIAPKDGIAFEKLEYSFNPWAWAFDITPSTQSTVYTVGGNGWTYRPDQEVGEESDGDKNFICFNEVPVFLNTDEDKIQAYKTTGDITGALNYEDLVEHLFANWIVGYTQSSDTIYTIACDMPQFADTESIFFGKGSISFIDYELKYEYLGNFVDIGTQTLPYGQTATFRLSEMVASSDLNVAQELALKILEVAQLKNIRIIFKCYYYDVENERTESTPRGFVTFHHGELIDYGFLDDITDDTITFKSGEVLDDDNSNVSNADIADDESDEHESDDTATVEDGSGLLTHTYMMNSGQVQALGNFLWSATFADNIKLLNNSPIENIISCKAFPFTMDNVTEVPSFYIGNVLYETAADKVNNNTIKKVRIEFSLEKKAEFSDNLDFLNYAPYTKIEIYIPFVGVRELPLTHFKYSSRSGVVEYLVDIITGEATVTVFAYSDQYDLETILKIKTCMGVDIPLTSNNNNQLLAGYMQNAIDSSFALASGNVPSITKNVVNNVFSSATSQFHSSTKGFPSQRTELRAENQTVTIIYTRPKVVSVGNTENGQNTYKREMYKQLFGIPCNIIGTLGSFKATDAEIKLKKVNGAFVQVENPTIKVDGATKEEIDEINRLLKEGVYV